MIVYHIYTDGNDTGATVTGIGRYSGVITATFRIIAAPSPSPASGGQIPPTGDNSRFVLWSALLLISGSAAAVLGGIRKRRQK